MEESDGRHERVLWMEISPAEEHEREWAARLMAASDPWVTLDVTIEECRRNCRDPRFQLYVARLEGEPCGMILLDRRGVAGSPYVKSIAVDPGRRGAGIGAALLRFAEDLFRPEAKHIFLCVSSFNDRARAFYERHGYKAVGVFEDYIIEGASEILMHKRLR